MNPSWKEYAAIVVVAGLFWLLGSWYWNASYGAEVPYDPLAEHKTYIKTQYPPVTIQHLIGCGVSSHVVAGLLKPALAQRLGGRMWSSVLSDDVDLMYYIDNSFQYGAIMETTTEVPEGFCNKI